jgi:hypothetical protein
MSKPSASVGEGRAIAARPSLRSIPLLTLALLLLMATAAKAEPPALIGTTPPSPHTDLFPLVHGNASGVIISALPPVRTSAIAMAAGDEGTIDLFKNKECKGEPAASGTAFQFDSSGIQIGVDPETTTYISAERIDSEGPSGCSNKWLEYQHVKELPPPKEEPPAKEDPPAGPEQPPGVGPGLDTSAPPGAPRLRTIPGGFANDNTPLVTGSAPGAASVRIFTNPECDGSPVAKGSVGEFEDGLEVRVVDNAVIAFYGTSVGPGGASSRCSAPVFYIEDSLTPRTRITMGPASKTRKRKAVFRFKDTTGDAAGTTFFCKFDRRKWKQCKSPLNLRRLPLQPHVLRVKATDPAGNVETKPAQRRFKVVPPL